MATKESIKAAIEKKRGDTKYEIWRIGITSDLAQRKQEWKDKGENVDYWSDWTADSSADAKDIEAHFINKGMKGGTGGDITAATKYVYVF